MIKDNNRDQQRFHSSFKGKLAVSGKKFDMNVVDINHHGVRIITGVSLPCSSQVNLNITFNDLSFNVNGLVVWSSICDTKYQTGIKFIDIDKKEISNFFLEAKKIDPSIIKPIKNPRMETYETTFESYHDEVFLRRVNEFVDYIIEKDPEKKEWAQNLLEKLKSVIENIKNEFEKWAIKDNAKEE